jgi:AcrR family transcriptional regulator
MVQSAAFSLRLRSERPRREAKRAEILRRAAEVFRERGFHAAGMRDIARALRITPGALYYYFRGKEDLLYFCQEHSLRRLLAQARRIAAGRAPAADRLAALVRAHLECLLDETGGVAAHLEFRALPPAMRAAIASKRDAYERLFRGVVADGVRSRAFRRVDPKLATLAILGALNGAVTWYRPEGPATPARIAASFADTLVGGLQR